jgi:glyoxylase-like metal-dependent hydrolase (beta-lactamase superfamily II)
VTIRIGTAEVDRVEEQQFPVPLSLLTDDTEFIGRRIAPLPPGFLDRSSATFQFFNHSWLIRADGLTALVDPCNGNGRQRQVPYFDQQDLPWLDRLLAAGAAPESVDIVFCTHLHNDHCGWNTTRAGHTLGHALLRLESAGERAYFTGDAFHHPAQLTRPELRLPGCDDLSLATASRRMLAALLHGQRAYLFPAHFAAPHYGLVGQDGGEYVFLPAPASPVS